MVATRYQAMDAQRFDPMRRKKTLPLSITSLTENDMGQVLRRLPHPELSANDVVGGIWSDHELVLVPLEVASHRNSFGSLLAESFSSTSTSTSDTAVSDSTSTSESSTYFTTPSPTHESGSASTSVEPSPSVSPRSRQVDTFDRDDLIITRTIIRPTAQPSIRGMFSRPSSPLSRPTTPVFQALNCFRPSAFEREVDDLQTERMVASQPVLQVIVTQTREQYEQDLAFKEAVQQVCPEAIRRRRAVH